MMLMAGATLDCSSKIRYPILQHGSIAVRRRHLSRSTSLDVEFSKRTINLRYLIKTPRISKVHGLPLLVFDLYVGQSVSCNGSPIYQEICQLSACNHPPLLNPDPRAWGLNSAGTLYVPINLGPPPMSEAECDLHIARHLPLSCPGPTAQVASPSAYPQ
ncbi:hypothetical protein BC834DRAFT_374751 [Gloeopeniophorella convolvens]|nr:hypothetical protein BC834DRAFT_374751 [Gloeopeniophorella convolvens]